MFNFIINQRLLFKHQERPEHKNMEILGYAHEGVLHLIRFGRWLILIWQEGVEVAGIINGCGPHSSASSNLTLVCTEKAFWSRGPPGQASRPLSQYNVLLTVCCGYYRDVITHNQWETYSDHF